MTVTAVSVKYPRRSATHSSCPKGWLHSPVALGCVKDRGGRVNRMRLPGLNYDRWPVPTHPVGPPREGNPPEGPSSSRIQEGYGITWVCFSDPVVDLQALISRVRV